MTPEADVIVFYMRDQDGEVVNDKFKLEIPFESSNQVSMLISLGFKFF